MTRLLIPVLTLTLVGVLGVSSWYSATAAICPVPLPYRVGELDPRFGADRAAAETAVAEAAAVWEDATGRELFRADPEADFAIEFIFDERQERARSEAEFRAALDAKQARNAELAVTLTELTSEYDDLRDSYRSRVRAYEQRLAAYNEEVATYNEDGGAPPAEYTRLEAEQSALDAEAAALEETARELNQLANEINDISEQGNQLVESYNRDVSEYNERFSDGGAFTQGEFQGDRIAIYKFTNMTELRQVMAHEFGHALGIEHVEDPRSVMYYLLEEQPADPTLTEADIAAFQAVCGTGEEWSHWLRRTIRSLLTTF